MSREDNLNYTEAQLQQYADQYTALQQTAAAQLGGKPVPNTDVVGVRESSKTHDQTSNAASSSAAGPFAGVGVFTASDPESALRLKGKVDWVAIRPDLCTPAQAAALRAAGFKVIIWQDVATPNAAAIVKQYGAAGYIAQAESQSELNAATANGNVGVPKALVSNNFMAQYPPGWIAMPEAYQNQQANATPQAVTFDAQQRGAQVVIPVLGTFGQSGPGVAGYVGAGVGGLHTPGVGVYLSEGMSDADVAALPTLRTSVANNASSTGGTQPPVPSPATFNQWLPYDSGALGSAGQTSNSGTNPTTGHSTSNAGNPPVPVPLDAQGNPRTPPTSGTNPTTGHSTSNAGNPPIPVPLDAQGNPRTSNSSGAPAGVDYAGFLGFFDLPSDVQDEINRIFQQYGDPQQAIPIALAYVRGTKWYADKYPGIKEGIAKGLFVDERGYRSYLNDLDQINLRFLGRNATVNDISQNVAQGWDINTYQKMLEGDVWMGAHKSEIQSQLGAFGDTGQISQDQLIAYGQQQAGLSSAEGINIQAMLEKAQRRFQTIFQGTLASPRFNPGAGSPDVLNSNQNTVPDVAR